MKGRGSLQNISNHPSFTVRLLSFLSTDITIIYFFLGVLLDSLWFKKKTTPKTVYTPKYCKKTLRRNDPDILTPFVIIIITGILTLITSSSLSRILSRSVSKCMYDVNSDLYPVIIVCMRFRCVHNHGCDFQGLHDEWLQLWQK